MNWTGVLLWCTAAVTVSARHRKEWLAENPTKLSWENRPLQYEPDIPLCTRGAGFYRDPQDCRQFIRCIDNYNNGQHFTTFVGRCEPGLVFDENTSSCNWPELSAPCLPSPDRLRNPSKVSQPQQISQNEIPVESEPQRKPYPQQEPVYQEVDNENIVQVPQKEVYLIIQESHTIHHQPSYQEHVQQVPQNTQISQEPIIQNEQNQVMHQQQVEQDHLEQISQQSEVQQDSFVQKEASVFENTKNQASGQNPQKQEEAFEEVADLTHQESLDTSKDQISQSFGQSQVQAGGFQQVVQKEDGRFEIVSTGDEKPAQGQVQQEWYVPEESQSFSPSEQEEVSETQLSHPEEIPILCSGEGFFKHPSNCSRFIRCVTIQEGVFSVHFFECPRLLSYDEKASSCVLANVSGCEQRTRVKRQAQSSGLECSDEGFFRHPADCRAFYRCVKQSPGSYRTQMFSCPTNLVFDQEYTTCNWPEKAPPCQNRRQMYTPTRNPYSDSARRPVNRQTQKPLKRKEQITSRPKPDYLDESMSSLVRVRTTQKPKTTTKSDFERIKPKCNGPGFFRNDQDCTKFYKCVQRGNYFVRYELSCPNNFAYDEVSRRCVAQRYVSSCSRAYRPYPPMQDDEESPSTSAEPQAEEKPREEGDGPVCEKEGYFRHPDDCNKFYRCVDYSGDGKEFVRYDFNCPEGLVFDEANSVCNWPDQSAPCEGGGGNKDGSSDSGEESGGYSTTSSYESTTEQARSSESEPSQTTSSSSTSGYDEDGLEKGDGNQESKDGCTKEGFYRNPDDCNKFYRCVDFSGDGKEFVRYDFDCPEGLVFDEVNNVCNYPDQSPPCDGKSPEEGSQGGENSGEGNQGEEMPEEGNQDEEKPGDGNGEEPGAGSEEKPGEESGERQSSTQESVSESPESSTKAANGESTDSSQKGGSSSGECQEEGFFRNPDDCSKFYRCVEQNGQFTKYDFACPEGLVFDEVNSVCNWPEQSAPCEGGKSGQGSESTDAGETSDSSSQTTESSSGKTEGSRDSTTSSTTEQSAGQSTEAQGTTASDGAAGGGTTSGGEQSKGSGECTQEGYYRNPDDCGKFYRCVDFNGDGEKFVRYDFDCPEGLHFDDVNSVCNWPEQSPKCETGASSGGEGSSKDAGETSTQAGGGSEQTTSEPESSSDSQSTSAGKSSECTEEGFYRCQEDCSKFYRCVDEGDGKLVRYDFKCPDGLIFDDKNKKCDYPSSENTCESTSTTTQSTTTKAAESSTTGSTSRTTQRATTARPSQESTTSSTTKSSSSSADGCTEEGFFRNPDDCSKYYRCLDEEGDGSFTREDFSCAEDEVFDEEMRYCNRKDLAPPCDDESKSSEKPSDSSECTEEGFFRCPEDCTKFYRCVDEKGDGQDLVRYDFQCPEGLIFDGKNKKCDYPSSELTCDTSTTTAPGQTTDAGPSDGGSSDGGPSDGGSSSSNECTEEGFFRNEDDCSKYYRCLDEGDGTLTREDFSCAEDEVFDEEMRYCNRKDLAPPCDGGETTTQSSSEASKESECKEEGFFRCPEDCTKFYRCVDESGDGQNYTRYDFECPEGLIFDGKNKKCDYPSSEVTCDSSSGSEQSTDATSSPTASPTDDNSGQCTEEGFFRNPEDCSKYYRCIDEGDGNLKREDFACEEDEVFDEEMRYCNRKDLAPPCDEQSGTSGSSSTSDSSSTPSDSSSTPSDSASTTSDSSSTTSSSGGESSEKTGECKEEGFHRDPQDCSKFYRCVDFEGNGQSFTKYEFECPEGLVFDETNDVCNWPSSVPSCESSSSSEGTTSNSASSTSSSGDSSTTRNEDAGSTQSSTASSESSTAATRDESSSNTEGGTTSPGGGTTSSGDSSTSDSSSGSKSSGNIQCTEEGFFRHPDDCTKFYRCVDFKGTGESYTRYDFECPDDLVFDEVNSVCNWPNQSPPCESGSQGKGEDSQTTSGNGDSQTTSGNGDSQSTTESSGTSTSSTNDRGTTSQSGGTSSSDEFQCQEEGFFKHPNSCKKYYECKRDEDTGELVKIDCECPEGHVFDSEAWYCNSEELSPPCDDGSFRCTEEGFFRDPEDCTRYYQCNKTGPGDNDYSSQRFQCQDGTVFDESGRYCNAPELSEPCDDSSGTTSSGSSSATESSGSSTTSSGSGTTSSGSETTSKQSSDQGECTEEGFFRNPDDCTKYYQCERSEETGGFDRTDYSCPDGRIFDEGPSYCNDPELSEQPCDSATTQSGTTQQQGGDAGSDSQTTSSSGTRRGGGNPECKEEGFFRHPDDCNKFYRCVDFSGSGESYVRYDFDCPEGLHFDEVNSVCNWPTMTPPCESGSRAFLQ